MVPWANPCPWAKRHLDRFSRFAGLTIVTDRPTDHATPSVTIGRIYVVLLRRRGLKTAHTNLRRKHASVTLKSRVCHGHFTPHRSYALEKELAVHAYKINWVLTRNSPGDADSERELFYGDIFNHFAQCAPEATEFGEITHIFKGHYAVQGHSRSPILVPIESSYTTSYWWSILTCLLSCTVSEIQPSISRKSLYLPNPPQNFSWMSTDGQGTKWHINSAENFNHLSRVHEHYRRHTGRQQRDGRATAHSEREREFTFAKTEKT